MQTLLDDLAHTPAFVIGRRTDVLAWNAMGAALITDFGKIPEKDRTYIRLLFTDLAMRELYADWEEVTRLAIAQLRMHNARNPGDPQRRRPTPPGVLDHRPEPIRTEQHGVTSVSAFCAGAIRCWSLRGEEAQSVLRGHAHFGDVRILHGQFTDEGAQT
ncbi:hypothetical protein [Streptomyces sp. NPDC050416]|uniref:MmyB family transcriptional regulator n=1 Tax=Streptomyces sp. NPDC050416 TaxID=3365611 RepID=UPI0037AE04D0